MKKKPLKERLIIEGIREISRGGIQNFSVRKVAAGCGVSCAAPYKYFSDKQTFLDAIVEHIRIQWIERQHKILRTFPNDLRRQIVEISVDYIRFMVENPNYRSIVMLQSGTGDEDGYQIKGSLSGLTQKLIAKYSREAELTKEQSHLKTCIIRTLLTGAAVLFDFGELEYNEDNLALVKYSVDREFDL